MIFKFHVKMKIKMKIKSFKWVRFGTKNLFTHISTAEQAEINSMANPQNYHKNGLLIRETRYTMTSLIRTVEFDTFAAARDVAEIRHVDESTIRHFADKRTASDRSSTILDVDLVIA